VLWSRSIVFRSFSASGSPPRVVWRNLGGEYVATMEAAYKKGSFTGAIVVHGEPIDRMGESDLIRMPGDIGMLRQNSALFDSMTVAENVGPPAR
jgi:hypothetical protein